MTGAASAPGSNGRQRLAIRDRLDAIPEELRKLPHWVAYKLTPPRKEGGKKGKVPVEPHTGRNASTTNFATWGTLAQALDRAERDGLDGVGFVFTDSGFAGVDLDHCRDAATGVIEPWALTIIDEAATYTEVSPSGTGIHCIARAKLPGAGRRRGNIEVYDSGRFFTITAERVEGTPPNAEVRQEEIAALYARLQNEPVRPKPDGTQRVEPVSEFDALASGNWSWRHPSQSEADLRFCSLLAQRHNRDRAAIDAEFRKSKLFRAKWDEQRGSQTYGELTIAKALGEQPSTPEEDQHYARALTDTGNAERLVEQFRDRLRYCHPWAKWLCWDKKRWRIDDSGAAPSTTKLVARSIYAEAARIEDADARDAYLRWAKASEKSERRTAMLKLATSEKGIPVLVSKLDAQPDLLNLSNGTLDLSTFELRPHRAEDYLTKLVRVDYRPEAECPNFLAFLERILPDDEVRAYLQRLLGYGLTGDVSEQVLGIAVGDGANGKSTLANIVQEILGRDYSIQIAASLLLAKNQKQHPTELADLFGVRLAFGTETAKGDELDEALVKQLTGGDPIRARRMREDFWQFDPTHKLLLLTNHMPHVRGREHAIWRRLHCLRFDVRIPERERDRKLPAKLRQEREGILAWMVQGCRDWRTRGLDAPEAVLMREPDRQRMRTPAEEFVATFVSRAPGVRTGATVLYQAYCTWSAIQDEPPISQREFGLLLGREGYGAGKSGGVMVYRDTALGEDWGVEGRSPAMAPSSPPHEGVNAGDGPQGPQSSPDEEPPIVSDVPPEGWEH